MDSEPVTDRVIAESLARYGLPLPEAEIHKLFVGGTMASVGEEATRRGATLPDSWLNETYDAVFDALAAGVPVIDGVDDLLDALARAKIPVAIASNGPRRKMEVTLTPSGLWSRFAPHIHSAHDDGRPKPDPHMIFKAMRSFGARRERVWFIDDSPTGIGAGVAAGVGCVGLDPSGRRDYVPGVHSARDMSEVAGLIAFD